MKKIAVILRKPNYPLPYLYCSITQNNFFNFLIKFSRHDLSEVTSCQLFKYLESGYLIYSNELECGMF